MDDFSLFAKSKKEIDLQVETVREMYATDGMHFDILKWALGKSWHGKVEAYQIWKKE